MKRLTGSLVIAMLAGIVASANATINHGVGTGKTTTWADMGITATTTQASYAKTGVVGSVDGEDFTYTLTVSAAGNSTALSLNSALNSIENVGDNAKFTVGDGFAVTISGISNANVVFDACTSFNVNNSGTTEGLTVAGIHYFAGDNNLTGAPIAAFEAIATQSNDATLASVNSKDVNFQFSTIPEPATLGMVAVVGGAILYIRRRLLI